MSHYTPIGVVPDDFPCLRELMQVARIDRRSETLRVKKLAPKNADEATRKAARLHPEYETVTQESWYIVRDDKPVPVTYKTSTGKSKKDDSVLVASVTGHVHFSMILDFIHWKASQAFFRFGQRSKPDRVEILLLAMGRVSGLTLPDGSKLQLEDSVKKFKAIPWKQLNNVLANLGVSGYSIRSVLVAPPPKAPSPTSSSPIPLGE